MIALLFVVAGQLLDEPLHLELPPAIEELADALPLAPRPPDPTRHRVTPIVVPMLHVDSDDGVGAAVVAALRHKHGGRLPYKNELAARALLTTKWIQRYELRGDALDVFALPLRLGARVGFASTASDTWCGAGVAATCDRDEAAHAALARGLDPDGGAYDDFVRRYWLARWWRVFGEASARWRFVDGPARLDGVVGWRAAWSATGTPVARGPYPGSAYARAFPRGEHGFTSGPSIGVVLDGRDDEHAPARGFLLETHLRGAAAVVGSSWTYGGASGTAAVYAPLARGVVLGQRLLGDAIVGDAPTYELARTGGWPQVPAFGGATIGRGVRDHRYAGALKLVWQGEVRTQVVDVDVLRKRFGLGAAAFVDAGWIRADLDEAARDPTSIVFGVGVGARVRIDGRSVARVDAAVSPFERAPAFYTSVGVPF